jgi:hypothetical protein
MRIAMKAGLAVLVMAMSGAAKAQVVHATVCEVLAKPASFDGKIVRIRGTVIAGMDEFAIRDKSCGAAVNGIWLGYPAGTNGKAGPAAIVQMGPAANGPAPRAAARVDVKLDKSKEWKQFDSMLGTAVKSSSCLGCTKYTVTATLVGRLDGVAATGASHAGGKVSGIGGFGSMNAYAARLVLQSVSDVSAQAIDYSKSPATSDDSGVGGNDPITIGVSAGRIAARTFPAGSESQKVVMRAVDAYGAEGDDNGVDIGFAGLAEVDPRDGRATIKSPDGVVYHTGFDMDRLTGHAMAKGIAFTGAQIADMRDSSTWDESSMKMEYKAWQTVVFNAMAAHQKLLVAPGGYVVWDAAWPAAEQNSKMDAGIRRYLTEWSVYGK